VDSLTARQADATSLSGLEALPYALSFIPARTSENALSAPGSKSPPSKKHTIPGHKSHHKEASDG
jgi:hypothetical protein